MTLQQALLILKTRLWLIVAGAVIAGAVAAMLSLVWPPTYKAETALLITKLRSSVTLDPRFQTLAEENVVSLSIQEDQVRRQTLVGLTESRELLVEVVERLADTLAPEERSVAYLGAAMNVSTQGNLILLEAEADSPSKAAAIANRWAEAYAEHVNRLYSATSPSDAQIQAQLDEASAEYEAAKEAVEEFQISSRESELTRQIEQKSKILEDLQEGQLAAARERVDTMLARVNRYTGLLLDVQGLQEQLALHPPDTALTPGEQFALFALEALAFGEDQPGFLLELGTGWQYRADLTVEGVLDHLARVQSAFEAARAAARAEAGRISTELLTGQDLVISGSDTASAASVEALQTEINALRSALQREGTRMQDLRSARDIAQENYLTLLRKAAEVQILTELTGIEVQLASRAIPPQKPSLPSPLVTTALGVIAGALAGLALAFFLELWPRMVRDRRSE